MAEPDWIEKIRAAGASARRRIQEIEAAERRRWLGLGRFLPFRADALARIRELEAEETAAVIRAAAESGASIVYGGTYTDCIVTIGKPDDA